MSYSHRCRSLTKFLLNTVLMHVECQCLERRRGEGALTDTSPPHQPPSGVDGYQFRSQRLAQLVHSSFSFCPTGSVSSPLYLQRRNLFMSHRCKCLYSMNAGWVFTVQKKTVHTGEFVEIVLLNLLSSLGMWDLSQTLAVGFKAWCQVCMFNSGVFVVPHPAVSLLRSRLQMPADAE